MKVIDKNWVEVNDGCSESGVKLDDDYEYEFHDGSIITTDEAFDRNLK